MPTIAPHMLQLATTMLQLLDVTTMLQLHATTGYKHATTTWCLVDHHVTNRLDYANFRGKLDISVRLC